jgi:hypothetical protein
VAGEPSGRHFIAPLNQGGALTEVAPFSLSEQQRTALRRSLRTDASDARLQKFIPAVEQAVATFITMRQIEGRQLRSRAIREILQRLGQGVDELKQSVMALHPQSLRHLDIAMQAVRIARPIQPRSHPGTQTVAPFVFSVTAPMGEETSAELDRLPRADYDRRGTAARRGTKRKNKACPQDATRPAWPRNAQAFAVHWGAPEAPPKEG